MTRTSVLIATTFFCGGLGGSTAAADTKALYLQYCGACHGPGGKGDGVAGTFMRSKPTDLTLFAKQNGGTFPARKVMEIIDGRNTVRWGEVFQEQAVWDVRRRTDVQEKIRLITDHIASIQEK
jgi:mono/diheme cytochrome c family protein